MSPSQLLVAWHAWLEETLHIVRHDGHTGAVVVSNHPSVMVTTQVQSDGLGVLDGEVQAKKSPALLQVGAGTCKLEVVHVQNEKELELSLIHI